MGGCAANDKLLVDLLHESNELIIGAESGPSVCAHAGNSRCRVKVGSSGALGRGHDFGLQSLNTTTVINYEVEAGGGTGHLVRELYELFEANTCADGGRQIFGLAHHVIQCVIAAPDAGIELLFCLGALADVSCDLLLLLGRTAVVFLHLTDGKIDLSQASPRLVEEAHINSIGTRILHLLKAMQGNIQSPCDVLEHASYLVIEDHLGPYCGHKSASFRGE